MKGNCKSGPLLMDGIKKINGNASKEVSDVTDA